jgi:hypothetical protein
MVGCGGRDVRNNLLATADEAKLEGAADQQQPGCDLE